VFISTVVCGVCFHHNKGVQHPTIHGYHDLKHAKYAYVMAKVDESGWFVVVVDTATGEEIAAVKIAWVVGNLAIKTATV